MNAEKFENIQANVEEIKAILEEATEHLENATTCETSKDLKANLEALRNELLIALKETEDFLVDCKEDFRPY